MDVFLPAWILFAYLAYVFFAERLSLQRPKRFSSEKHGIRAYKRELGYWVLISLLVAGVAVSLFMWEEGPITKGVFSIVLGGVLALPGFIRFRSKQQAG